MDGTKALNTRYVLFTRYGEEDGKHRGNGQDKCKRADSDTCRDKKEAEDEGRREGDVHGRREYSGDEEVGGHELGGGNEAFQGSCEKIRAEGRECARHNRTDEKREKRRIVADTNVLVSATFWNGNSARIVDMAQRGRIELVISEEILNEYARALNDEELVEKVVEKELSRRFTVAKLIRTTRIVEPKEKIEAVAADKDDNKIIEAALEGKARFILTYDRHLLKLGSYEEIRIITPEDFLGDK